MTTPIETVRECLDGILLLYPYDGILNSKVTRALAALAKVEEERDELLKDKARLRALNRWNLYFAKSTKTHKEGERMVILTDIDGVSTPYTAPTFEEAIDAAMTDKEVGRE